MDETINEPIVDRYRRYELPVLALLGIGTVALIERLSHRKHTISLAAFVALSLFTYMSRYIVEPVQRRKSYCFAAAAILAFGIMTGAQVLFIEDLVRNSPEAAIVNMNLTGIFISTVMYLYLLGAGLEVGDNYARRFNKNYRQREVPGRAGLIILFAYLVSAAKYLFVLGMMKRITR